MTGNAIKVTLVVLVLFFLLFGGFGFYFMSRIGTVQKEESLEKELQKLRDEKRQILEDNVKLTQDKVSDASGKLDNYDTKLNDLNDASKPKISNEDFVTLMDDVLKAQMCVGGL